MSVPEGSSLARGDLKKGCLKLLADIRSPDRFDAIIILGVLAYTLVFSFLSLFKFNTLQSEYDLAVFNQALLNTVTNGDLLTNSLEHGSHFGVHFSPILFTLVPIYGLFPTPITLLIAQSILLGLGAVPIYLCGREILGKGAGCVIGFLYLIYPSLHGVNLYEFHEVAFLPVLLGLALWCFVTERKNQLLLFGVLALLVKEDVSLIIGMIGLVGLYQTRNDPISDRWQYIVLIVVSFLTLGLFFLLIKPFFSLSGSAPAPEFLNQYVNPLTSIVNHDSYTYRLEYILESFIPVMFIPFLSLETLIISAPSLIEILLSGSVYYSVWFHYSALIIPGIFFATIMGLSVIQSQDGPWGRRLFTPLLVLMVLSSVACTLVYSPAVKQVDIIGSFDEKALNQHREFVVDLVAAIPLDASISTQFNLLPFVSAHQNFTVDYADNFDIILLDNAFAWRAKDFLNDKQKIDENYDLILKKNYVELYVNKENVKLQSQLKNSLKTL